MFAYQDQLQNSSYFELRQQFPTLRESVYDALKDLSPSKVAWTLEQLEGRREFNPQYVDRDTQQIILNLLSEQLEQPKLRMTREEMCFAFYRIKELLMIADCVEQGIFTPVSDDDQTIYKIHDHEPVLQHVPTEFVAKSPLHRVTIGVVRK